MTDYSAIINEKLKGTMADLIGMRVTYADLRRVVGELTVRPDLLQPYGYVHGGALMALMDTLAGMASAINVAPGQGFLTIEMKTNFLRSIRSGLVIGEATAVHVGRRTHVWQVTAHDAQGRQLALATLTQLVLELRDEAAR
jgi:uncharacterized protein (TIGR00369 family)